uniref:Uncharacterized protein n=1 Tax=Arundo donax TaxID=35708 RepID=A0A0A8YUM1_ARUDO
MSGTRDEGPFLNYGKS